MEGACDSRGPGADLPGDGSREEQVEEDSGLRGEWEPGEWGNITFYFLLLFFFQQKNVHLLPVSTIYSYFTSFGVPTVPFQMCLPFQEAQQWISLALSVYFLFIFFIFKGSPRILDCWVNKGGIVECFVVCRPPATQHSVGSGHLLTQYIRFHDLSHFVIKILFKLSNENKNSRETKKDAVRIRNNMALFWQISVLGLTGKDSAIRLFYCLMSIHLSFSWRRW